MAVDMFLLLEDIEGESRDQAGHEKEIDVLSWNFGAKQSGTGQQGGGSTAGRVEVRDMEIVKYTDKASPLLFFLCCNGTHIAQAVLTIRKAGGGQPLEYLKITMEEVLVSGYEPGGNATTDDLIKETVRLNFSKCKLEYTPQESGVGTGGGSITKGFDIAGNVEWE
jgi:type VI secretion system secreted protein Hcp